MMGSLPFAFFCLPLTTQEPVLSSRCPSLTEFMSTVTPHILLFSCLRPITLSSPHNTYCWSPPVFLFSACSIDTSIESCIHLRMRTEERFTRKYSQNPCSVVKLDTKTVYGSRLMMACDHMCGKYIISPSSTVHSHGSSSSFILIYTVSIHDLEDSSL